MIGAIFNETESRSTKQRRYVGMFHAEIARYLVDNSNYLETILNAKLLNSISLIQKFLRQTCNGTGIMVCVSNSLRLGFRDSWFLDGIIWPKGLSAT